MRCKAISLRTGVGFNRMAFLLALLLALDGARVRGEEKEVRKYAVLVGVREYDRNQLRSLPYPENDVQELADVLKQSGFRRVELLTQTAGAKQARYLPMAKTIRDTLKGILEDRLEGDLVLVAFAGHGVQFKGEKEHYFCPMDAVLTDKSTLVSLTEVYKQLEQSKAGAKLLIVDACRNDPLAGNARDASEVRLDSLTRPQLPDPPGGVAALFSCSAGQRAFEDESLKHGVFFHHVLLGLRGEAKLNNRNNVTWDGLVAYVKVEVPDTVKDLFGNTTRQIPENKGELRGDVTIISSVTSISAPMSAALTTTPAGQNSFAGNTAGEAKVLNSGVRFRWCPPTRGAFAMGSPASETGRDSDENQVQVTLSSGFWMSETEVTQEQWKSLMKSTPWKGKSYVKEGSDYAASYISHGDAGEGKVEPDSAVEFCQRLTELERKANRLPSGWKYALPTEAQWEYACRAGEQTKFNFGDDEGELSDHGWWGGIVGNGNAKKELHPHSVGQKAENAWGLRDMHGNVSEWCSDWYRDKLPGGRNPSRSSMGSLRVFRGGGWYGIASRCRSASRGRQPPDYRYFDLGFRVVAVP